MSKPDEECLLAEISPEEMRRISEILADTLVQAYSRRASLLHELANEPYTTRASWYKAIPEREVIQTVRLDLIASSVASIWDPLGQLRDWLTSMFNSISSWIVSSIKSVLSGISKAIDDVVSTLTSRIRDVRDWIYDAVSGIASSVSNTVSSILSGVVSTLSSLISGVTSYISSNVLPAISGVVSSVTSSVSSLISGTVMPAISGAISTISGLMSGVLLPAITGGFETVSKLISDSILPAITSIVSTFSDLITGSVVPAITNAFTSISNLLSNSILPALTSGLTSIVDFLGSHVIPAFTDAVTTLSTFLNTYVIKPIYSIGTIVATGFTQVSNVTMGFINAILQFPQWFPTWFWQTIGKPIYEALTRLGDWIWGAIPEWLRNALISIPKFFDNIWKGLQDFIKNPLVWLDKNLWQPFLKGIQAIGDWIWKAIPDWMKMGLESIGNFFRSMADTVIVFLKDPAGYLGKLAESTWGLLQSIGGKIWEGLNWLWSTLVTTAQSVWKTVLDAVHGFGAWLWGSIVEAFKTIGQALFSGVMGAITAVGEALVKSLSEFVKALSNIAQTGVDVIGRALTSVATFVFNPIYTAFSQKFNERTRSLAETLSKSTPPVEDISFFFEGVGAIVGEVIGAHYLGFGLSQALHSFASFCDELRPTSQALIEGEGGCALEPLGLGARLRSLLGSILSLGWHIKPSYIFREMAKDARLLSDTFTFGLIYGITFWSTRPLTKLLNVAYRDVMVIELPSIHIMQEIVRRRMPTDKFEKVLKDYQTILKLYGYRTSVIDWLTSTETKIEVKDRFFDYTQIPRTIFLSQMYELPSASDVATMMVRDIFASIEDFQKLYKARGMTEDIGALYYFLRFRYPPPERLWQFTMRGISGLLWASASQEELADIKKESEPIGALLPKSPVDLNFQAKSLMNAYKTYMKWHDYARFSWIKDFPSDNLIYIDTLAEIPTKIDQRWMVKWALYELLAEKKVSMKSQISEFRTNIVEGTPSSAITMDLTLFSRTLQATGMHPDWVPLTAVAEAMNTLVEERTMMRSGILSLFKEGFWDTGNVETLLAGLITASFQVSYFDISKLEWNTGWVNAPVMYLPAERKLVELRSLMDRALDILRETQRDISIGYQEWIIGSYDEYKARLTAIISRINEFFAKDYKTITNVDLPADLQLKFVEEYYKPYVESLAIWRDIHTIRRVRYWTQRWLGWVMYRVAMGVVRREDVLEFVAYVGEEAKLTPYETDFIKGVMDRMYGITVREYAPTPTQIATLAEYVVISQDTVNRVLNARFIPAEWRDIWVNYINARPIADDVKAMLSAYRRALLYAVIPEDVKAKVLSYAKLIGFTDRELEVLALRNQLEEIILDARESKSEYIPTMSMLASISEYVPKAREFFDEVVVARHIPKQWIPVWADYVDLKPLVDDMKRYLSRAETQYVNFMITKEMFLPYLNEVSDRLGYTSKEIEFLMKVTELERASNAWTELIGTVERLVSLSEYSPKASEYALGKLNAMIDSLPVSASEKAELKEIWQEYIRVRPVKSEAERYITDLINAYVEGTISDMTFEAELVALKQWGISDNEMMFYKAIAGMRKARKLKIVVG